MTTLEADFSRRPGRVGTRTITTWVATSVSAISLFGCASVEDKFFDVYAYNSTESPVIVTIVTEGLEAQRLKIPPLDSLWIAPGDECRHTTAVASSVRGRTIGEFEGAVCAEQHLVVSEAGIGVADGSAAEPSSGRGVDDNRTLTQHRGWTWHPSA